jgi:septum site-determining protein MinC
LEALMSDPITIKGIREGLLVTVDEAGTWAETSHALLEQIDHAADFFKGARLALAIGPRTLSAAELGRLRDDLSERTLSLWAVLSESPLTVKSAQALGLNIALPSSMPQATLPEERTEVEAPTAESDAMLVRRTLRSGGRLHHPGHVVVIGDVNPGAEIIAGGDIVVWGRLRGVAQAGVEGDEEAVVCALDLAPTQLRIAHHIATSPARKGEPKPEMARVKGGQIIAERWSPKGKAEESG